MNLLNIFENTLFPAYVCRNLISVPFEFLVSSEAKYPFTSFIELEGDR